MKRATHLRVLGVLREQRLDRDLADARAHLLLAEVDAAHAALAEDPDDPVAARRRSSRSADRFVLGCGSGSSAPHFAQKRAPSTFGVMASRTFHAIADLYPRRPAPPDWPTVTRVVATHGFAARAALKERSRAGGSTIIDASQAPSSTIREPLGRRAAARRRNEPPSLRSPRLTRLLQGLRASSPSRHPSVFGSMRAIVHSSLRQRRVRAGFGAFGPRGRWRSSIGRAPAL